MHYQFESKVAVEMQDKNSFLQKLCIIGGLLSVICTLAVIMIEGLSGISFLTGVFVPVFLLWRGFAKHSKIEYVPCVASIDVIDRKIIIKYLSIKRFLNAPSQSEVYEYSDCDIKEIQFSSELSAIRILGYAMTSVSGKNDKSVQKLQENVVYLPDDKADELVQNIEKLMGITMERMR